MRRSVCAIVLIVGFIVPMLHRDATLSYAGEEGLVGYWTFDKDEDQIVLDSSGRGFGGIGDELFELTEGIKGKGFLCKGGCVNIESNELFYPSTGITIGLLFKTDVPDQFDKWMINTISAANTGYRLGMMGGKVSFQIPETEWSHMLSCPAPAELNKWTYVVATYDNKTMKIFIDGEQKSSLERGGEISPSSSGVYIGNYSAGQTKHFFEGVLDEIKMYSRALSADEIQKYYTEIARKIYNIERKIYNIEEKKTGLIETPVFDFKNGIQSWAAKGNASVSVANAKLQIKVPDSSSFAMNDNLNANIDKANYMSIRMAVDRGSTGNIIFATTKNVSKVPFQIFADGKMHTYVFEPLKWNGWSGNLVALGIDPSEIDNAKAEIESIKITEDLQADPEIQIDRLLMDSALPRAERPEKIFAKIKNLGGTASNIRTVLKVPEGVILKSPVVQEIASLGYREEKEVFWTVEASKPLSAEFRAEVTGEKIETVGFSNKLTFLANLKLPKASYVPEPKPVKGKYNVWVHYFPGWKEGKHAGWKIFEPYPERKPVLGFYDEGTPDVADWHIKYMLEHGISAVIYCWYRITLDVPVTVKNQLLGHAIHDGILKAKYLPMIKFAIMWENGCGAGVSSVDDLMKNVFPFWIDNYFSNPSYLKVDGKPVLYVWVPGNVTKHLGGSDNVRKAFAMMREECRKRGLGGLYIVGCIGGKAEALLKQMAAEGWDASSSYGLDWTPPKDVKRVEDGTCAPFEGFIEQQEDIIKYKNDLGALPDIAGIMMGWDPRPYYKTPTAWYVISAPFFWSDNTPEKFRDLCRRIKVIIDSKTTSGPEKNTIIFCNWTELGEGHYIEPTRGYGFSYVDVIRDVFTDAPREHLDIAPEDVGLGPYDSWYQQTKARAVAARGDTSKVSKQERKIADNLIAYWTFDKDEDQIVLDSSGRGFGGIGDELFELTEGIKGKGFLCKGGCVTVESNELFYAGITIELWFKTDVPDQFDKWMINTISAANTGYRLGMIGGKVSFQIPETEWSHMLSCPAPAELNKWTYVAATYDNKTMKIFIDGEQKVSLERGGRINPSSSGVYIGNYGAGQTKHFFEGILDEIKMYSRALSADEIKEHFQQYKK